MKRTISMILMLLMLVMPACGDNESGYTDVPPDAWYAEAVMALRGFKILIGKNRCPQKIFPLGFKS